jgi:formylglycine-generating enzyme required for sulfatase activity
MRRLDRAALALGIATLLTVAPSCSDDSRPKVTPSDEGSISIDPNPNNLDASWMLMGPNSYCHAASGDVLLEDLDPGSYTVSWGAVAGWTAPANATQDLAAGGSITFSGTYTAQGPIDPGFVLIDDGSFLMGAPEEELGTESDEHPQHTVTLTRSFYLQSTEVTNEQYRQMAQWAYDRGYATATSSSLRDALDGSTQELLDLDGSYCEITFSNGTFGLRDAGYGINPDHPVKWVTWFGSAAYCDWLSLHAGLPRAYNHSTWQCNGNSPYTAAGYRLPTEAEWEYACRAGSTTAFANGPITYIGCSPVDPVLNQIGWFCGNDQRWTSAVGQKSPNAWGLYDMHGNIWEWCNDFYSSYSSGPISDPVGPASGSYRMTHGGGWNFSARTCRSANRSWGNPDYSYDYYGFRPARSAD